MARGQTGEARGLDEVLYSSLLLCTDLSFVGIIDFFFTHQAMG